MSAAPFTKRGVVGSRRCSRNGALIGEGGHPGFMSGPTASDLVLLSDLGFIGGPAYRGLLSVHLGKN